MTRRLTTIFYDSTPDPASEALYETLALDANITRQPLSAPAVLSRSLVRRHAYTIKRATTGYYPTAPGTLPTVTHALRGGTAVREWAGAELLYSAPTGTTVEARLRGPGASYYWKVPTPPAVTPAPAWAVAGAGNWNTPDEVMEHFAAFPVATARRLAIEWRLSTADKTVTPSVYGALIGARILHGARSGATAAATGADSWDDDAVVRTLLPWLTTAEPEVLDEFVTTASTTTIDYSSGIGLARYNVSGFLAAYNLTDDPEMLTPLSATWNAGTKVLTFGSSVDAGKRLGVRLTYTPRAVYTAGAIWVDDVLPQVVVDRVRQTRSLGGFDTVALRRLATLDALVVRAPVERELVASLLLQAETMQGVLDLHDALLRLTGGGGGATLVSSITGLPVLVFGMSELTPGDVGDVFSARVDVRLRFLAWYGAEQTKPLVKVDGVHVAVGYDTDTAAR